MIGIILIVIGFIIFVAKVLNCTLDLKRLMFVSIFTLLTGIAIMLFVVNDDSNFAVSIKLISVTFVIYGIITGIQVLRYKE